MVNVIELSCLDSTSLLVPRCVGPNFLEMKKAIQQTTERALAASLDCQMEEVTAFQPGDPLPGRTPWR